MTPLTRKGDDSHAIARQRKILTLLVTMLVVSLLTFAAFDMISGDPAATLLGTQATPEKVAALRAEMGLDRPHAGAVRGVAGRVSSPETWAFPSSTASRCGS